MTNKHSGAAYIRMVANDEADDDLRALMEQNAEEGTDNLDHVLRVHSLSPQGMRAHLAVYESAMRGTRTLRKVEREMIALIVSDINSCHY